MGVDFDTDGRATIPFDYDGDGDLDLAVLSRQKLQLLENRSPVKRHFVRFSLQATTEPPHGLGATVRIKSASSSQIDYITATSGYVSGVQPWVHFGLGEDTRVEDIVITWPSGAEQRIEDLAADEHWRITQGDDRPQRVAEARWPKRIEDQNPSSSFELPERLRTLEGVSTRLPRDQQPVVVNFWASWCEACKEEIPELVRFAEAGQAQVIGITMDEQPEAALAFAKQFGMTYPNYLADDAVVRSFFGDHGGARLPATFVLNAEGSLHRAFFDQIELDQVVGAVRTASEVPLTSGELDQVLTRVDNALSKSDWEETLLRIRQADRLAPGELYLFDLGGDFCEKGFYDHAVELLREAVRRRGQYEHAIARFKEAWARSAHPERRYYCVARALEDEGRIAESIEQYEQSLEVAPDWAPARAGLERAVDKRPN